MPQANAPTSGNSTQISYHRTTTSKQHPPPSPTQRHLYSTVTRHSPRQSPAAQLSIRLSLRGLSRHARILYYRDSVPWRRSIIAMSNPTPQKQSTNFPLSANNTL